MTAQMNMTMSAIENKVLTDAIKRLQSLGVRYAIVDRDGVKHGDLEIVTDTPMPRNNYRQYGYIERVDAMQVGDVEVFENTLSRDDAENYRSAIVSRGIRQFGKGSMTSCFNAAGAIEVMRIA